MFRPEVRPGWLFLSVATFLLCAAAWPALFDSLAFHRQGIIQGQWWRLVTAHLTHVSYPHLLLNLVGLWLICALYPFASGIRQQSLIWLFLMAGISCWLLLLTPDVSWYAGLSGALHGRLLLGSLLHWLRLRHRTDLLVAAGTLAKVIYEQFAGAAQSSEKLIGAPVLTDSHLAGAVLGGTLFLILLVTKRFTKRSALAVADPTKSARPE